MSSFEATWTIVQLVFWIAVIGAIGYFCFLLLGLALLAVQFCFMRIVNAIKLLVESVLFFILHSILSVIWFVVGFVGLKPRDKRSTNGETNDSSESSSSGESNWQQPQSSVFDPYQILQVTPGADSKQVREAYLRQMSQYHPDKVAHLGSELRAFAEEKAKSIQQAYSTLQNA